MAPAFICVANIAAADGGARIVEGNQKVLAARLSDARFFWDHDLRVPLEKQADKLGQIVFHEKLGTVADKVERIRKLAAWLVEEEIVKPPSTAMSKGELASFVDAAARICKADLVTGLVGEFPELQGVIGGHLALCQGHPDAVSDAVRDHYKPVGQGDEVPTDPVTVAVSLADKLDTMLAFFGIDEKPTGSRDPFALRRAALGMLAIITQQQIRLPLTQAINRFVGIVGLQLAEQMLHRHQGFEALVRDKGPGLDAIEGLTDAGFWRDLETQIAAELLTESENVFAPSRPLRMIFERHAEGKIIREVGDFFADRLKVQQREAGVRHDLIDAVFALGGEDDLVRLLARVRALQAFVETAEGKDLLAGYKRAANILKKEGWGDKHPSPETGEGGARSAEPSGRVRVFEEKAEGPSPDAADAAPPSPLQGEGKEQLSYSPEIAETALIAALDSAEPEAAAAVEREDFEGAMLALAGLRGPVDAFFNEVIVNDPDPAKREARLNLLARIRGAVHRVADFSRIEG